MLAVAVSILIGLFQVSGTGTVIGLVKLPSGKPGQGARVVLVPSKYIEVWNKEVQQRLDNYWEIYKPDLLANKENVPKLYHLAYVEALRITAIRANDNKVIMNEKVYRVNEIVERNLGVRLVKVANDSLTFADGNGVTYVKYF